MHLRFAASSAAGVLALGMVGSLAGPHWAPQPLPGDEQIEVVVADTTVPGVERTVEAGTYDVVATVVEVELDGAVVEARVMEPVDAPAPHPAMLFVHGAGTGLFTEAFVEQSHALASAGIVTMVPNKRLDTYGPFHRDYVAMAGDYLDSFAALRSWPGVDPTAVAVYGESEGGWIAPVMAAREPAVAAVALVSAPVVPPRQQAAWAADSSLRSMDVPAAVYRAIPRALGMELPGGRLDYGAFDVTPFQQRMDQPTFVAYGTGDFSMPIVQGARRIMHDTAKAGGDSVTVRYYEGADHGLRVDEVLLADFVRDLTTWTQVAASEHVPTTIAGDQPEQRLAAGPVVRPPWYAQGDTLAITVGASVGALLLAPLSLGVRRVVGRRGSGLAPSLVRPLVALGASAVLTLVALGGYYVGVTRLALENRQDPLLVNGGWIGVRALGIATVVAAFWVLARLRDLARRGARPAAQSATARFALWAALGAPGVLLVVLAYWGAFPLGV